MNATNLTVTVRYWAAAAEAAGREAETRAPGRVGDILAAAAADHPSLGRIVALSGILLDGVQVRHQDEAVAGSTLEVLPPFAGG